MFALCKGRSLLNELNGLLVPACKGLKYVDARILGTLPVGPHSIASSELRCRYGFRFACATSPTARWAERRFQTARGESEAWLEQTTRAWFQRSTIEGSLDENRSHSTAQHARRRAARCRPAGVRKAAHRHGCPRPHFGPACRVRRYGQ